MASRDIVSNLPMELALHIFEYFTYLELLPVLSTCSEWRRIALDCRVYWSHTVLRAPTDGGAQTLAFRLSRANGRPCVVYSHTTEPCNSLTVTILPALGTNIHSIFWLSMHVHVSQADGALELLCMSGWNLQVLELRFILDTVETPLPVLPHDLLQGYAPRLRLLSLDNVEVPHPPPAIFASVPSVGFGYFTPDGPPRRVPDLWAYFPIMTRLKLFGDAVPTESVVSVTSWAQLEWLRLEVTGDALLQMFLDPPTASAIARVPHVEVVSPNAEAEDALAQHVDGVLQIALQVAPNADNDVRIHLGDTDWRRSRGIVTSLYAWLNDARPPSDILSRSDVVERLVSLTIPDVLWQAVTRSSSKLPNLKELRLVLDHASGVAFKNLRHVGTLICPSLTRLVLRVDAGEFYVTLDQLRAFVSDALRSWDPPLELQFEGVTLVGYGRRLPDDETFTYSWKGKGHWTYPDPGWE